MTTADRARSFRWQSVSRVIVAMSGTQRSGPLLRASIAAARALDAELHGVYVRDTAIGDLAGLPNAAILGFSGGGARPLSRADLDRAWAREEETVQATLSATAAGTVRKWSFESASGQLGRVLADRLSGSPLVAIEAGETWAVEQAWALVGRLSAAAGALLVVPPGAVDGAGDGAGDGGKGPVLALYDVAAKEAETGTAETGTAETGPAARMADGAEIIALADRIALAGNRPLTILALSTPAHARHIADRIHRDPHVHQHRVLSWPDWRATDLAEPIAHVAPSIVVASLASRVFAERAAALRLLRRATAPLLLIPPA